MSIETGGPPAFPTGGASYNSDDHNYELVPLDGGMTLRDYFAAKAMGAMVDRRERTGSEFGYEPVAELVGRAYEIADAMMKARSKS